MLCLEGDLHSVINVRVTLENYAFSRSLRRIYNRGQRQFRIEIGLARVDEQREALYANHKRRFKGFIFESLEEFLFAGISRYLFDTHEVAIYEGEKLVAVSYFDIGQQAIASLLGLYVAGYPRHSLGVLTMLHEMQYAQQQEARFYYPGYVLRGYPGFDYKLRLGSIQYYNWAGRWRPLDRIGEEEFVAETLKRSIKVAEIHLRDAGIAYRRLVYPFFSVGYLGMMEEEFVRGALCLEIWPNMHEDQLMWLLEYNLEDQIYQLSRVRTDQDCMEFMDAEFSEDFFKQSVSESALFVREELLLRNRKIEQIVMQLKRMVPRQLYP
jgi:leucyl-tRNA---protein transferase